MQNWGANIVTNGTSLNPTKTGFTKLQQDPSVTVDGTEEYISRPFGNGYDGVMPLLLIMRADTICLTMQKILM